MSSVFGQASISRRTRMDWFTRFAADFPPPPTIQRSFLRTFDL
jgi:hypothetical protein